MGVEAIVKGLDGYLRDVAKMDKANANFNEGIGSMGGSSGRFTALATTAKSALTGFGIAAGVATGAALALKGAYDKTIASTVTYNKAALDTANAIGLNVEEYTRIVQVADDFGISQETVSGALEMATKKGFEPNLKTLAELSDKTNAMLNPTERAAYLSEIFGRNWASLNPLLRLGGERIKELAAGIDDALVVTDAEAAASEELRLSIDTLNDSWQGLTLTVGQKAIPTFTKFVDFVNRTVQSLDAFNDPSYSDIPPILRGLAFMRDTAKERDAQALVDALLGREGLMASRTKEWASGVREVTATEEELAQAAKDAAEAIERQGQAADTAKKQNIEFYTEVGGRAETFFDQLNTYARKFELGGVDLRIADAQVQRLMQEGILTPEQARQLAESFMPIEVVRKAAQDAGYDMGEKVTKEMQTAIKDALVKQGISEKEAGAIVKAFVSAPEAWVNQETSKVLDTITQLAQVTSEEWQTNVRLIEEQALGLKPTLTEVYGEPANQLERALILADQLNQVMGGTWTAPTPTRASPRGLQEDGSPTYAAPSTAGAGAGAAVTTNMNMTVNTAAPASSVVADFGLMRALARRR